MIPKIIHYCWFGRGKKPKMAKKCIASWKKYCPDYQIIEWNEDNFDVQKYPYARYCLEQKRWAFLSDFVRLVVIAEHGGVYFDTDVELLKKPDKLLQFAAFYCFENNANIATGLGFGAEANHQTVLAMTKIYLDMVPDKDGNYALIGCPALNTEALIPMGLELNGKRQNVCGAEILPAEYMNPYDDPTGRLILTANTVSVHWYSKSWMSKGTIFKSVLTKPFHRVFGEDCFSMIKRNRIK